MSLDSIYYVVAQIPRGKVATYGQIARLAGLGRGARQVGRALRLLPEESLLPWHRVVNSRGALAVPADSDDFEQQNNRLRREGISLLHNRVDLTVYQWQPEQDPLIGTC